MGSRVIAKRRASPNGLVRSHLTAAFNSFIQRVQVSFSAVDRFVAKGTCLQGSVSHSHSSMEKGRDFSDLFREAGLRKRIYKTGFAQVSEEEPQESLHFCVQQCELSCGISQFQRLTILPALLSNTVWKGVFSQKVCEVRKRGILLSEMSEGCLAFAQKVLQTDSH